MIHREPGKVRYQTVEWLGGPIRICTRHGEYRPILVWAPWDENWTGEQKQFCDSVLLARIFNEPLRPKAPGRFGNPRRSVSV